MLKLCFRILDICGRFSSKKHFGAILANALSQSHKEGVKNDFTEYPHKVGEGYTPNCKLVFATTKKCKRPM